MLVQSACICAERYRTGAGLRLSQRRLRYGVRRPEQQRYHQRREMGGNTGYHLGAYLRIPQRLYLTATVLPEEATDKTVTWSSSAEKVATVENGVVTPLAEGTAIITAKAGEFSAECTVTVTAKTVAVTGIALDQNSLSLEVGESVTLTTTVFPDEATNKSVVWTTSAEKIAVVENGTVMAVSEGVATITVKTVDGNYSAQCQVSVSVPEDAIDLTKFKFRFNNVGADNRIPQHNTDYHRT